VKITLKQPFSAFINILAHPATAMISGGAEKVRQRDRLPSGGNRAV
jgi:hypothetical protein